MNVALDTILNGSSWFKLALALATAAALVTRSSWRGRPRRVALLALLSLVYGVVMAVMALGHLTAIALKRYLGTLSPTLAWWAVPLGVAMLLPACWLAWSAVRLTSVDEPLAKRMLFLHAGFVVGLIPVGPSSPLALPALLNIALHVSARPAVARTVMGLSALAYVGMFIASFLVGSPA
jgi:hypothetical protein